MCGFTRALGLGTTTGPGGSSTLQVLTRSAAIMKGNLQLACWKGLSRGERRHEKVGGNIKEGQGSAKWGWNYRTSEGGETRACVGRVLSSHQFGVRPLFRPSPEDQRAPRGLDSTVVLHQKPNVTSLVRIRYGLGGISCGGKL